MDPEVQFRHTMDVRTPIGLEGPLPAIVMVHGGAWKSGDSTNNAGLAELYAQRGFATYAINYTLSSPEFPSFPANIQDVLCAIRTLRNPDLGHRADPNRIVVMGTSAGGHLSALAALIDWPNDLENQEQCPVDYPDPIVQLAVDYFGPTDLQLSEGTDEEATVIQMIGNKRSDDPQGWTQGSPISHVDAEDPHVFIAHGSLDASVNPGHSTALHNAIQAVGGQSTLVLVEDGEHGMHRVGEHNLQVRCVLEPLLRELLDL
jgi:acetyl esterase/lipase